MDPNHDHKFLETILASIADGVFTVDRDWNITSFNRAAERITGIPARDAIGRRCSDVFHADICERNCALRHTVDTGVQQIDVSARILSNQGRAIPISLSTAVLRDAGGNVLGAAETFRDLSALEQLRREIDHQYTFEDIVGKSDAFRRIFALLPDVADSESTVLIEGPSGSGKELIARAVHNLSPRRNKPYVALNCGALPNELFESELFGYEPGAFTDARRSKPGRLALAEGGTLFLDEISELPLPSQVKLLRVLQERQYEPLGGVKVKTANVRVVAATNQHLVDLVSQGRFRDDLYFRLAVVRLSVPALRERREDIPFLVDHFVARFNARTGKRITGVSQEVMELFMRYDFPGNARELENAIEYAFVLCHNRTIEHEHLPDEYQDENPARTNGADGRETQLVRAEAEALRTVLWRTRGNLRRATEELGISRATLWRKLKRHNIDADEFRERPLRKTGQGSR